VRKLNYTSALEILMGKELTGFKGKRRERKGGTTVKEASFLPLVSNKLKRRSAKGFLRGNSPPRKILKRNTKGKGRKERQGTEEE